MINKFVDQAPELAPREGIDPDTRFVEQQQPGPLDQRAGEAELLLHAAGERTGESSGEGLEPGERQQSREGFIPFSPDYRAQIGVEFEIFDHRQILVEAETLGHIGDDAVQGSGVCLRIVATNAEGAVVDQEQASDEAQECGLAGAVGPDQTCDLAGLDLSGQRLDGGCSILKEAFCDPIDPDKSLCHDSAS